MLKSLFGKKGEETQNDGGSLSKPKRKVSELEQEILDIPIANTNDAIRQLSTIIDKIEIEKVTEELLHTLTSLHFTSARVLTPVWKDLSTSTGGLTKTSAVKAENAYFYCRKLRHFSITVANNNVKTNDSYPQVIYNSFMHCIWDALFTDVNYFQSSKDIWANLNHIYLESKILKISKKTGFDGNLIPDSYSEVMGDSDVGGLAFKNSINDLFKTIILITIADPYRMHRGDIAKLIGRFIKMAKNCDLMATGKFSVPERSYYIDIDGESPPRYAMSEIKGSDVRYFFSLKNALEILEKEIEQKYKKEIHGIDNQSMMKRAEQSMMQRLLEALEGRGERQFKRQKRTTDSNITIGISGVHYWLRNEEPFEPEVDEMGQYGLEKIKARRAMDVVDFEEYEQKSGGKQILDSTDLWCLIYEVKNRPEDSDTKKSESFPIKILNTSEGGLLVQWSAELDLSLNSGDLVGIKEHSGWEGYVVRWCNRDEDGNFFAGLKKEFEEAETVAIRVIEGTGQGSEYTRGLLISKEDEYGETVDCLIAPPLMYSTDSLIAINMKAIMIFANINKMGTSNRSYTEYFFEETDTPETEEQRQEELEQKYKKIKGN